MLTYLFPSKTSGEQYSTVPQKVLNHLFSSVYDADPKSINFKRNFLSMIMFSSYGVTEIQLTFCEVKSLHEGEGALLEHKSVHIGKKS